ncbi:hypothetical protein GCM10007874_28810 [Labrys miyagiensis]|uniref:Uncharacterized protein n=1 Tax=Labrys miyagiensis TaxID=346912 RepID=A0ABQ6CJF6_9HYPH|nr:hypothetical protein GCM10007874_28810 [Labrys miyagiensis]
MADEERAALEDQQSPRHGGDQRQQEDQGSRGHRDIESPLAELRDLAWQGSIDIAIAATFAPGSSNTGVRIYANRLNCHIVILYRKWVNDDLARANFAADLSNGHRRFKRAGSYGAEPDWCVL